MRYLRRRRIRGQGRSHMSNARAVGAVSTAKLLIQNPKWSTGLLPRQPAILPSPNHSRSRPLPHVNARPWERSRPRSFGFKTHNGAPAFAETACDTSRRRTTRGQDSSHTLNARPVGAKLLIHTHDEAPAITETACDISRRRRIRGQDRSHMSNARPVGAVSTAKLLIQNAR